MPIKKESEVFPVYYFYGTEDLLIQEEIQEILDQTLSPKERSLNLHRFSGEEHSGQEIAQAAQTLPMFARYRVVLVREADEMDQGKVEILMRYLQRPSPKSCLLLYGETLGLWKAHRAEIEKLGRVVECSRLKGRALVSWIRNRMVKKGKELSEEAADYLVEVVGDNLYALDNALEKVFLVTGEKRAVGLPDVEGVVSEVRTSTVFELTDAIGRGDVEKALGILGKVLESKTMPFRKGEEAPKLGDPIPLLLSMMARQYRLIWSVREMMAQQVDRAQMAKALKISPWNVRNLIDQSRRFPIESLRDGIRKCHSTDLAIKKGRGPRNLLMEKLVIDLCGTR